MSEAAILFPFGVRLSTWLTVLVFMLVAAWRSEQTPVVAATAWLAGFEAAYQVAAMLLRTPSPVPLVGPISISLIVGAPLVLVAMTMLGARPEPILLAGAAIVFVAWLAAGFHVNTDTTIVSVQGEALNDASKTLLALAYLVPLFNVRVRPLRLGRAAPRFPG